MVASISSVAACLPIRRMISAASAGNAFSSAGRAAAGRAAARSGRTRYRSGAARSPRDLLRARGVVHPGSDSPARPRGTGPARPPRSRGRAPGRPGRCGPGGAVDGSCLLAESPPGPRARPGGRRSSRRGCSAARNGARSSCLTTWPTDRPVRLVQLARGRSHRTQAPSLTEACSRLVRARASARLGRPRVAGEEPSSRPIGVHRLVSEGRHATYAHGCASFRSAADHDASESVPRTGPANNSARAEPAEG